jgi:hypothetical protein
MYDLFSGWDGVPLGAGDIPLFYQGLSEEGATILEDMSYEIQLIRARLTTFGLDMAGVYPLATWLLRSYGDAISDASSLRSAFVTNRAYAGLKAPVREAAPSQFVPEFAARYLAEDVPYGLAVSQAIARLADVETHVIDQVVAWANEQLGKETKRQDTNARTPQKYGLRNLEALIAFGVEAEAQT